MKYKIIYFLTLIAVVFTLSSCKKWLDVSPATQIKEDEQFSSQQGFIDALIGTYQKAAGASCYGNSLTFGLLDVLAQRYENKSSQTTTWFGQAARYNYTHTGSGTQLNVFGTIESTWSGMYAAIARANYILKNIEAKKSVLSETAYNIIKGEALALRGFLHFDLLRLYAPAYLNGTNAGVAAIPYMAEFTVSPQSKLDMATVLNKCEQDLKEAESLLAAYQTIDQIAGNQGSTSGDLFLLFRQNHLNYWAAKAALARLYLYKDDKANALAFATQVINSGKFRFMTQAELNSDETNVASDLTFTPEHIFSIYVSDLKTTADLVFKNATPTGGDASDLFSTRAKLDAMYEVSQAGYGTDIRNPGSSKSLWYQLSATVVFTKKFWVENITNVKQRLVPVIKLAEMYYIAAEAAPAAAEGVGYLNTVRAARLIPALATTLTSTQLNDELLKEYRKEFYGEGQLWFYYKRNNTTTIPDGVGNPMTPAKYLFPMPQAEIEFGK
jgi:starch-binding outer membrane protein, SusD/RagB family